MTAHSSPNINELSAHSAQEDHHPLPEPEELDDPPPSPVPSYPHSQLPTPAYTSQPQTTEQTVTRGPPTAAELTGQVTYEGKRFRITFGAQPPSRTAAEGPEYTRGSKIRGIVRVEEKWREKIAIVELKVLGTIKLSIADSGSTNTAFLSHTIRLYPSATCPASAPCPGVLSFKWPLPTTYLDTWGNPHTHRNRPLPPTYELTITEVPGLRARVRYEVEAAVKWKWKGLVSRKESLTTPFTYIPYAPHPHHSHTSVLSTLKSCPGEWICHTERVPTRGPDVGEIISSLVLPTPPLHPLSQPIPFHFQLSAECPPNLQSTTTNSGRRRLSITSTSSKPPRSPTLTRNPHPNPTTTSIPIGLLAEPALLRLTIQRQVSVDVRGARALRVICGGVGRMERVMLGTGRRVSTDGGGTRYEGRGVQVVYEGQVADNTTPTNATAGPAPPAYTPLRRTNSIRSILTHISGGVGVERVRDWDGGRECFAIAWEGSVVPERDVLQVGGFRAGGLLIKDFVTLTVVPPTPELSPLRALHQAVPVKCIVVSDADMQAAMNGSW
ncbi:hypothetical protein RhiLY_11682 [Ceratobasidium sp. AG-Ba]|nr:hypothetical protein RhiLY_11682 [Ceratobasidium sp. AG-Ba]